MSEVVTIYDNPPPALADLRKAIIRANSKPMNYWDALIVGAADRTYTEAVRYHYDWKHNSGDEMCACGESDQ